MNIKIHNSLSILTAFSTKSRFFNILLGLVFIAITSIADSTDISQEAILNKARAIHKRVITLDSHIDINVNNFTDTVNYTQDLNTQITLDKMYKGGLDIAWFVVYTAQGELTNFGYEKAYKKAISKFEAIHKLTEEIAPNDINLATTSNEARSIHASGKRVAMIGIENGYPIAYDIKRVKEFYDLGGRYMSLSHNEHSQLSDSHTGEKNSIWLHNGLSDFGKDVIKEMNKLGMLVDISHASKRAVHDIIKFSKAPIIASHSSSRTLSNHSRNLDDGQLNWIKANGGIVQAVAYSSFVNVDKYNIRKEKVKEIQDQVAQSLGFKLIPISEFDALENNEQHEFIKKYNKFLAIVEEKKESATDLPPAVDVADFVDHIDYLVEILGIEHVGISSDFDGGGGVEGWNSAIETMNVTFELVKRGYTEDQISQLWSENFLRILEEAALIAMQIQDSSSQ